MKAPVFLLALMVSTSAGAIGLVGFKKQRLDENVYAVEYQGNAFMSRMSVMKRLLCGVAKLARKEGYNYAAFSDMSQATASGPAFTTINPVGSSAIATTVQGKFHNSTATVKFSAEPLVEGQKHIARMAEIWGC